ncbi:uncharacterized protein LOC130449688 [Diorhabda sublineata]|uniref:uncharacterized protein LOC130449688 n=1 Tax=Diorhabda sublineata TaxID=1163346 RepID=UPI0024E0FAEE|nr:uncharacterized protein LOC130449688 [Diorhabda sublineata]
MAQFIDSYVLQVLLLILCFLLEINSNNTTQVNQSTNANIPTIVKPFEKASLNETKANIKSLHNTHNGREHVTTKPNYSQHTSKILVTNPDLKKNNESSLPKLNISTTVKPHKPIITVHDELVDTLKVQVNSPSIAQMDTNIDKRVRRAAYIMPIVAVILSVPLVAVLISLLYKKGKDWWQHRNYRRMDYLIEGMYNS